MKVEGVSTAAVARRAILMLSMFTFVDSHVHETFARIGRRDKGAGVVEYLLLVLFIALALILALGFFSGRLGASFSRAGNSIPS